MEKIGTTALIAALATTLFATYQYYYACDRARAVKWLRRGTLPTLAIAAWALWPRNYDRLLFNLALAYHLGEGFDVDKDRAAEIYAFLGDRDHLKAINNLAYLFEERGTTAKVAADLYLRAAKMGHPTSQYNLAVCYERGTGVARNQKRATKWYRRAAEQGDAPAQFNLAIRKQKLRDHKEAVRLYQLAAEQEYGPALNNLAICYDKGLGVETSMDIAVRLYERAIEQDSAEAAYNLAMIYRFGLGGETDMGRAIRLYEIAAKLGHREAAHSARACKAALH